MSSPMLKVIERDQRAARRRQFWFNIRIMIGTAMLLTGLYLIAIGVSTGPDPNISFHPKELAAGLMLAFVGCYTQPSVRRFFQRRLGSDRFPTGKSGW